MAIVIRGTFKTPYFLTLGLGNIVELPAVLYNTEIKFVTNIENWSPDEFSNYLDDILKKFQKPTLNTIFGDGCTLEFALEVTNNSEVKKNVLQSLALCADKYNFVIKLKIQVDGLPTTIKEYPDRKKLIQKNHVVSHFKKGASLGAILGMVVIWLRYLYLAGTFIVPTTGPLFIFGCFGALICGSIFSLSRMYFNYTASLFDTKEKLEKIDNLRQLEALEYGARADTLKESILSYSRYQTYLYPMTFASARENKTLVEKVAPELKNKLTVK
ncbi:MAG: hypothetical protein JSS07_01425 [Proteobacteria bacterium]|nr:hypothetical protein [Pseudomonadota bacterium]